jgi:hypothetical protein
VRSSASETVRCAFPSHLRRPPYTHEGIKCNHGTSSCKGSTQHGATVRADLPEIILEPAERS